MHLQNFIHRDIKASHIFIDENLKITLIDFGFAKELSGPIKKTNSFCGTIHAMAPELLECIPYNVEKNGGKSYDFSVDLYAFGVLIYEMKFGKPISGYISSENIESQWQEILKKSKSGWEKELVSLSGDIGNLIQNLLIPNPDKRITLEKIKSHPYFIGFDWKNPVPATILKNLDEYTSYIGILL